VTQLAVRDVIVRFGGVAALSGVGFDVEQGELFSVIGPNGAGKTSLLNVITGVYRPERGSVQLDGVELVGLRPPEIVAAGVARTLQNLGLFDHLDVITNLLLGRHHLMRTGTAAAALWRGRARREEIAARTRCELIAEAFGLADLRSTPVGVLPYGMRKRVELARAVAMEPRLLLLDEPVAGLNREETGDFLRNVLVAQRDLGLTVVMVEHDMHLVMDVSDRVLVLDFGQVISLGSPEHVQNDPAVLEAYLGVPESGAPTAARSGS
jgi:branched-chain amino acid transport system ATP-binding protein